MRNTGAKKDAGPREDKRLEYIENIQLHLPKRFAELGLNPEITGRASITLHS
jgi:hypothetical protein